MSETSTGKRIAKNTMMLYFRQILIMLVSLYTVRVVLDVLGAEDFGIYNVVGGIVTFFSFLSATMASATQRFFSFSLGKEDEEKLNKMFTVNWVIYGGIAVFALVLLETVGLVFVKNYLNVPADRFLSVLWIYQFSIFTFLMSIISSPFMALIIAHEQMQFYAYISILEVLLKLFVVFLLILLPWDKLEVYGALLFFVSVIVSFVYIIVCSRKFKECQFKKFYWERKLFYEILSFTGWTMFGQITTVTRKQAIIILINQFFNPTIVASRAIANTISHQINVFSQNFNIGLYPPIIKSYASDKKDEMFSHIFRGCKISFFLMWVFTLPLIFEVRIILSLWLKQTPPDTVAFTRLALLESLIVSISLPLVTAARAPGKMRQYELCLGILQLMIFFGSLFSLSNGYSAISVYVVAIVINIVMFVVRILLLKKLINLSIIRFIVSVVLPVFFVAIISFILLYILNLIFVESIFKSFILIILSFISTSFLMYLIGLTRNEKVIINNFVKSKTKQITSFSNSL